MKLTEIEYEDIDRLNDKQLTKLLLKLLTLEAAKHNFESLEIDVPQKINTGDGGEDGSIKCKDCKTSRWITNTNIIFQNKAYNLRPEKCKQELIFKDQDDNIRVKPQIKSVLDDGGKYILFMGAHPGSTKLISTRIDRLVEGIIEAGETYTRDQFDVYDSQRIANWVNEHIAAITYVQECCDKTRPFNLKTWDLWHSTSKEEHDLGFAETPSTIALQKQIAQSIQANKVLRIIGHSGIGKSRLILETFNPKNPHIPKAQILSSSLVYIDIARANEKDVESFISSNYGSHGLVILDNCPERLHNNFASEVRVYGNLRLLTIDHSINTLESNSFFIDKSVQNDIVREIFASKYGSLLSPTILDKLVELSDDYPKMAVHICNSIDKDGLKNLDLNLPKEEILNSFIKKLIFGHQSVDEGKYRVLRSASIFKRFAFIDPEADEVVEEKHRMLASKHSDVISNSICRPPITPEEFDSVILDFKRDRGVVERAGTFFYVRPEPLAANLAADWILSYQTHNIIALATKLKEVGLLEEFCDRLISLDQVKKAKVAVQKLLEPSSPFASAEELNTEMGSRIFRSLVEVDPTTTVRVLKNAFQGYTLEKLRNEVGPGRRNLIWALEKLVFNGDTFEDAIEILFAFAAAENENIGNNATRQFLQIFQVYLPGTEVSLKRRVKFIDWALKQNEQEYLRLAISALGRGLTGSQFSRMGGAERQGSRVLQDYRPENQEILSYWESILNRLTTTAIDRPDLRPLVKVEVAQSIRSLYSNRQGNIISNAIKEINKVEPILWEEALAELRSVLEYDEEYLVRDDKKSIKELLEILQPKNLEEKFISIVSRPEWNTKKDNQGNYVDISKKEAEELATEVINDKIVLKDYLHLLVSGEQRQGYNFGRKLRELLPNAELAPVIIDALHIIDTENQNPELLAGFISACTKAEQQAFVRELINDKSLYKHVFHITQRLTPSFDDINDLFVLIDKELLPITSFYSFKYGRSLDYLNPSEVIALCKKIASYDNAGKWTSLIIIGQYVYHNEVLWRECKGFIKHLILDNNYLLSLHSVSGVDEYLWAEIVYKLLAENDDKELAKTISLHIVEASRENKVSGVDSNLQRVSTILVKSYFEVFWSIISESFKDSGVYFTLKFLLGSKNGSWGNTGILFSGDTDLIIKWCEVNKPLGPKRIAYMMPIYELNKDRKILSKWHPFALQMINEFGDVEGFLYELDANMSSFSWTGSTVKYYRLQQELIAQLYDNHFEEVVVWAKRKFSNLEKQILRETLNDEEMGLS